MIVSGPSGAGKGTLIEGVLPRLGWVEPAVSATTRPRRPGEIDGHHYHFLSEADFERHVAAGEFLEHVDYAHHRYGSLRWEIDRIIAGGRAPLVEIELRGARAVRAAIPDAFAVFIAPPSLEELARRLTERGTDKASDIAARMEASEIELRARHEFDCVIVNDDVAAATDRLTNRIVEACTGERNGDDG